MLASLPARLSFSQILFSYSTAGSLPVKEHSTADSLRVKEDWPEGTRNSNYIADQEAPAEGLPKFSFSLHKRHQNSQTGNTNYEYTAIIIIITRILTGHINLKKNMRLDQS